MNSQSISFYFTWILRSDNTGIKLREQNYDASLNPTFLRIHMNEFTAAILIIALLSPSAQDSTFEDRAVFRVQQTPASRYDPTLPGSPFGNWLTKIVGPESGVSWRLGECVDQNAAVSDWEQGVPACVEAIAILPDDRKVVAQIYVGSFKQGLSSMTRFHFAVIESDSQFQSVQRLSDLPQLLRVPSSAKSPTEGKRPNVVTLPQIRSNGAPQFYYANSPALLGPPQITPVETTDEPPAIPSPPKLSKVVAGYALTRVAAIYPPIAKQMKASGEVQVAITIDENGRVIEAKATSGHPALRPAAEEAAKKWVFKPASLDGKSMRQRDVLTFTFNLPK
jgi:TonB family protein